MMLTRVWSSPVDIYRWSHEEYYWPQHMYLRSYKAFPYTHQILSHSADLRRNTNMLMLACVTEKWDREMVDSCLPYLCSQCDTRSGSYSWAVCSYVCPGGHKGWTNTRWRRPHSVPRRILAGRCSGIRPLGLRSGRG